MTPGNGALTLTVAEMRELYLHTPTSKTDIAKRCGLSRERIRQLVDIPYEESFIARRIARKNRRAKRLLVIGKHRLMERRDTAFTFYHRGVVVSRIFRSLGYNSAQYMLNDVREHPEYFPRSKRRKISDHDREILARAGVYGWHARLRVVDLGGIRTLSRKSIAALRDRGGEALLGDIYDRSSRGSANSTLLEYYGFVTRRRSSRDLRLVVLTLTKKAYDLLEHWDEACGHRVTEEGFGS